MKVLRVIADMNPACGGPCQGIRNSIPELQKLGVKNEVVTLDDPAAPYLGKDPFVIHALGPGKGPWCYSAKLVPWLLQNLGRFDVVIVHGLWLFPSYAVQKALQELRQQKKKRPKFYVMPHGMLDPYFQQAPERKLKALRNIVYWKLIEEKVVNRADGLLFTCEAELLLARQPFQPYKPKCEINVGYGIASPPAYNPAMRETFLKKCPGLDDQPYLLFLSRIHEKKGVDLLIQAYATLLHDLHEQGAVLPKLVLAGPGMDTPYGQKIRKMVSALPQPGGIVFFPGMLSGDAKWGAFYGCEAFVLPSHQENFGIAVVEALACGKPVLISEQVNIWREIKEAGGGMVAPDSVEGTRQLLRAWLVSSAAERQAFIQGALTSFTRKFSIGPAAKQLLEGIQR